MVRPQILACAITWSGALLVTTFWQCLAPWESSTDHWHKVTLRPGLYFKSSGLSREFKVGFCPILLTLSVISDICELIWWNGKLFKSYVCYIRTISTWYLHFLGSMALTKWYVIKLTRQNFEIRSGNTEKNSTIKRAKSDLDRFVEKENKSKTFSCGFWGGNSALARTIVEIHFKIVMFKDFSFHRGASS